MDALYIINVKQNDVLLAKEFRENENNLKLQRFLMEGNKILNAEKSPFVRINDTLFIYFKEDSSSLMYLSLVSEDNLINSVYTILLNINKTLLQAFNNEVTVDLIRDNFVEIMLMIDQYLLNGVPTLNEINALSGLVSPYNFKDKITEKFIGKAKDYDTRTLLNYVRETQTAYENYKYQNENIKSNYEILFHYNDYLEMTCDSNFEQLNKSCVSEIEVCSQIPYNIELNLLLNLPFNTLDFSVDEGVITKRKDIIKKKNVDCVIKHGKYELMQFIPILTTQLTLPFKILINSTMTNNIYNLNVQVEIEQIKDTFYPLDDVNMKLYFPNNFQNSNLSVNVGEFEFAEGKSTTSKEKSKMANWSIQRLEKAVTATLKGNLSVDSNLHTNNCVLVFSCKIDKFSISGGTITKGTITKNPKNLEISKKGRNFTFVKNLEIVF